MDDIDTEAIGDSEDVKRNITGATSFVVLALEHKVEAEVSWTKSVILASSSQLRQEISLSTIGMGIRVGLTGKKLGTDFTLGGARRCAALKNRLAQCRRRDGRFKALRQAAGRTKAAAIHKTGAMAAAPFGVGTVGVSDSHLKSLRQSAAKVRNLDSQLGSQRLGFC